MQQQELEKIAEEWWFKYYPRHATQTGLSVCDNMSEVLADFAQYMQRKTVGMNLVDPKAYAAGYMEGTQAGLDILREHMDYCIKPSIIIKAPTLFSEPKNEYHCLCPCNDEGGCVACDRGNHDLHLIPKEKP